MDFGRDKVKRESKDSVQKWFSLMSNSKLKLHEKVYSMVIDDIKNLLYTCGSEKIIMSTNLKQKNAQKTVGYIKCSNAKPLQL